MLPAPAQGAVGVEVRTEDTAARALVSAIDDVPTSACIHTERALLAALRADCHSPVAALARIVDGRVHLDAELLDEDGTAHVLGSAAGDDAMLGGHLAADLLARAPDGVRRLFG
jgi:hydroxymethylbilane synthase